MGLFGSIAGRLASSDFARDGSMMSADSAMTVRDEAIMISSFCRSGPSRGLFQLGDVVLLSADRDRAAAG